MSEQSSLRYWKVRARSSEGRVRYLRRVITQAYEALEHGDTANAFNTLERALDQTQLAPVTETLVSNGSTQA